MKRILSTFLLLLLVFGLQAREGMWLPQLLAQLNYEDMRSRGLQLSAEDIYSVNQSSLKDAIVHFNGGCTAELISDRGLLLTNHHCGYSMIQKHSTLENNYLEEGFWAMNLSEEKANPGADASIVQYLEDVTNELLTGVNAQMTPQQRDSAIAAAGAALLAARREAEPQMALEIKPFAFGNQFILIAKKVFEDMRLVGAPPSSIGKFGADTDNWMWPRHSGDFALFRIYANADNQPAPYSADNQPYQPRQHLKINIAGVKNGDFTMVYGFPGSTQQYLPAAEVKNTVEHYNPLRIGIRDEILSILDAKMRKDEATRLKYASKYASISNSWKRWKGEILGIERTNAIANKRAMEEEFENRIAANPQWQEQYSDILPRMIVMYQQRIPLLKQRYSYIEAGYYGSELNRHFLRYRKLVALYEEGDEEALQAEGQKQSAGMAAFFKNYEADLDEEVYRKLIPMLIQALAEEPLPKSVAKLKAKNPDELQKSLAKIYARNPLSEGEAEWTELLAEKPAKAAKLLQKSEAYQLANDLYDYFREVLNPAVAETDAALALLQQRYYAALTEVFPDKMLYPDANSTLRVAYGQVAPYESRDAVIHQSQTYLKGVMEKYIPGDYEFDLPAKLIELYEKKDFAPYGEGDRMPVCFVATNHTTGGNSGSPVLNARGELIGLNFDRAWEGVMSDLYFDSSRCRNVMVDLRYVLFIVDKFAGAGYLVEEMDLVTEAI